MATPIFVLPLDLTSAIFSHCLPDGPSPPSPHTAPLLLAQICRQWREFCLDTPTLWASIVFGDVGSVELLKMWLARSKSCPLSLSLQTKDLTRGNAFMDSVMPHSARWRDVRLVIPPLSYTPLTAYHGPFPTLARLELSSMQLPSDKDTITIRDAPFLREAYLSNLPHRWRFELPLEQLTTLDFLAVDTREATRILQRCTALEHLSCRVGSSDAPPPALSLHSLRSLTVVSSVFELLSFTTPRLEQLNMGNFGLRADRTISGVRALLSRSGCDLISLTVRLWEVTPSDLQLFLSLVPSIISLKLSFATLAGFQHQIQVLGIAGVLPRLRHLEVSDSAGRVHFGPLLDVLRARRLESFRLLLTTRTIGRPQQPRIPPADVLDQFRALAAAGLQMRISTKDGKKPVTILDTLPVEFRNMSEHHFTWNSDGRVR
ncbi:hypothetical protein DFH07DRAFT_792319 [Mycena maculata]|uniref:F-box domain-containing protein n=1 Tax=Mycena maculata TaxID=230809 RepID=A0AAD7KBB5_9AGAR|nr:hypothetical protein DFH07DRAFT_792319 [Mycena maculata]